MSGKQKVFLIWDAVDCASQDATFIPKIAKRIKANFSEVMVISKDQRSIVPGLSDLSTVMPVITRFGAHALYDVVVDIIAEISKKKTKFTIVLIANRLSVWINLFRRIVPQNLIVISQEDPNSCLDFAFLPDSIRTVLLRWPDLSELQGMRDEPTMQSITMNEDTASLDEASIQPDDEELASAEQSMYTDSMMKSASPKIKPLSNMTRQQISVRSPKAAPQSPDGVGVPVKFQPLIEAMRSAGKAMISVSDLEKLFADACDRLNMPASNMTAMIDKAAEAGLVIMDKSINYVRFRNRSMASGAITYV